MIIESNERSTGMGATRFTAVLQDAVFMRVSELSDARYLGRISGVEAYEVERPEGTIWARFYRSNSGNEAVSIHEGEKHTAEFGSFSEAELWAASQTIETVVVTRHPALVEYLKSIGLIDDSAKLISGNATPEDVNGKRVIGVLPNWLACEAESLTEIPLNIPVELRGKELTVDQLREFAGEPVTYQVIRKD